MLCDLSWNATFKFGSLVGLKLQKQNQISCVLLDWMSNNFIQLNTDKTEVVIIASDSIAPKVAQSIGSLSWAVWSNLRNLGVIFDQTVQFNQHIKLLNSTCFSQLRNIAKLNRSLRWLFMLLYHPSWTTVIPFSPVSESHLWTVYKLSRMLLQGC